MIPAIEEANNESRDAIAQAVIDTWIGAGETIERIAWPNRTFVLPVDEYWLQVSLQYGLNRALTLTCGGGSQNEKSGLLILTVFGPLNVGTKRLFELASAFEQKFDRANVGANRFAEFTGPTSVNDSAWATAQTVYAFTTFVTVAT